MRINNATTIHLTNQFAAQIEAATTLADLELIDLRAMSMTRKGLMTWAALDRLDQMLFLKSKEFGYKPFSL